MGRNNKYATHVEPRLEEIKHWCRDGAIEKEICAQLGISETCFENYKHDHEYLRKALKEGKEIADYQVEDSLFKRALGYSFTETTSERIGDSNELKLTKEVVKHIAPEVIACIFWLKNRCPEKWRDIKELNNSIRYPEGINVNVQEITGYEDDEDTKKVSNPDIDGADTDSADAGGH